MITAQQVLSVFDSYVIVDRDNPKILQITDMQIIDATQCRYPERLNDREKKLWTPERMNQNALDMIIQAVNDTKPDLIIITGDMVYGEFDDSGRIQKQFFDFIDGFKIPWAPIFGNHDNESLIGVEAQCDMLESYRYSLFKRGNVTGKGNYNIGIIQNGELVRWLCMLDSHGCAEGPEGRIVTHASLYKDQLDLIESTSLNIEKTFNKKVPGMLCYHIPDSTFAEACKQKGYNHGNIGVDYPSLDGDFGYFLEGPCAFGAPEGYIDFLKANAIDTLLYGHDHLNNCVVNSDGIRYVFGTKTGLYDYHSTDFVGATLIDPSKYPVEVKHIYYPAEY